MPLDEVEVNKKGQLKKKEEGGGCIGFCCNGSSSLIDVSVAGTRLLSTSY